MAKSIAFAHPGFSISVESGALIRGALRDLRICISPKSSAMNNKMSKAVLVLGLSAVELVLQLHLNPTASTAPVRRIRLQPKLIGALAELRQALLIAIAVGTKDNEPGMNWLQSRAYRHSERVVEVVGAVMRGYRGARARTSVTEVSLSRP